jgi:hypothetical protein
MTEACKFGAISIDVGGFTIGSASVVKKTDIRPTMKKTLS